MSDSLRPHGLYSPRNSPGQNTGVGRPPSPVDLPNLAIAPRFPALQADSLPSEPPRKPVLKANPSLFLSVSAFPSIVFYTWQSLHIPNMLSLKENHFLQILSPLLIFVTLTHFSFSLRPSLPLLMHTHR